MLGRQVQAALATGIAAGDDDAARAAVRSVDIVARGFVRRRLEGALVDAALACDAAGLARPAPSHVMRIAALLVAGQRLVPTDIASEEAVASAFARLPAVAMPRFPLMTAVTAMLLAGAIAALVAFIVMRPGPPSRTYTRPMPAPSAAAFQTGGVPLRDAAVDALFGEPLTSMVVAGGRAKKSGERGDLEAALKDATKGGEAFAPYGAPVVDAWRGVIEGFARGVWAARRPDGINQRDRDDLREAVRTFTEALAGAGLGYFLEGRFKNGYPFVQAYRVVEVKLVGAAGAPRRVLSLRRLDRINTAYAALGMHDGDVGDPVLHLERIDENVASTVMPLLAADAPYPIGERAWLLTDQGKALAAKVGAVVRREYLAAVGADATPAAAIGALLVGRDEIIEEWRDSLDRKGIVFVRTDDLFLPPNLLAALENVVPKFQRDRIEQAEEQMAELGAPRIHATIHDLVAATVRRHEAQHAFDYDRDSELRYPTALADLLGAQHGDDGNERAIVYSARHELSAYLSQVANDPVTPHASLWHLGRNLFTHHARGTGEFYAAVVVFDGLVRHLKGPHAQHRLDRERLVPLALFLADQPGQALRGAAKSLWLELFGEPLTEIIEQTP